MKKVNSVNSFCAMKKKHINNIEMFSFMEP